MRKISRKQAQVNTALNKVYKELRDTLPPYCSGCGRSDVLLSFSHLIPRSRRSDLITEKRNITYHCIGGGATARKGCHQLWEGGIKDKQKLLDYHSNLEYILEVDTEYYFLITEKN